jgi:hypothetical protein
MNSEIANGFLHTGSKIIWTYNMRSLCSQQVYWSTFSFINDLVNIIQNADTETCRHQGTPPGAFCPPVTLLRKQIGHSHLAFPFHGIKISLLQLIRQLVYWCSFQIPPPPFCATVNWNLMWVSEELLNCGMQTVKKHELLKPCLINGNRPWIKPSKVKPESKIYQAIPRTCRWKTKRSAIMALILHGMNWIQ